MLYEVITPAEPDAPADRWVLSWADFMTLLFAFFVVMYAVSSVNEEKYRSLSEALATTFTGQGGAPAGVVGGGGSGVLPGGETDSEQPAVRIAPTDQEQSRKLAQLRAQLQADFVITSYSIHYTKLYEASKREQLQSLLRLQRAQLRFSNH